MAHRLLRKGDGLGKRKDKDLVDLVRKLQRLLNVHEDGMFGPDTETGVLCFQKDNHLDADGLVGSRTWEKLESKETSSPLELKYFHGDLNWVHAQEGHAGKVYWPGGHSGVTLDPGVDLGHIDASLFDDAYKSLLSPEAINACRCVLGLKGEAAKAAMHNLSSAFSSVQISRQIAAGIFPFIADPYWRKISKRYPPLTQDQCPGEVQTALLSIAFNRGASNPKLSVMDNAILSKNWIMLADVIGNMQQDHKLKGIRLRRQQEAQLIRTLLN